MVKFKTKWVKLLISLFINKNRERLSKLVESDRYKNSDYRIQIVNGKHGILHTPSETYVDLKSGGIHKWKYGTRWTDDCFSSLKDVLVVFDFVCPIVKQIHIQKTY